MAKPGMDEQVMLDIADVLDHVKDSLERLDVVSPLVDVGFGKSEIRELSKDMGLDSWDKPAFACLATRIPYGVEITRSKLEMVEKAEYFLQDLGVKQFRVRYHNDVARIEVDKSDFQVVLSNSDRISKSFKDLGFQHIALDIEGYRTGSLNEALKR